jgi:hypothetical protein
MKWHLVLLLPMSLWMQSVHAQDVRRCERADGSVVFTDGRCTDEQNERPPVAANPSGSATGLPGVGPRGYVAMPPSCSRTADDLLYGVRTAVDMRDTNQLAKHYHWLNVSDAQAEQLMDRLEKLVNRPLLDIQLIYPAEPGSGPSSSGSEDGFDTEDGSDGDVDGYQAAPHRRAPPYALKLMQFQSVTGSQAHSTVFRLQRHFDCWWIRF